MKNGTNGFTLIEVLVVVLIIGILSSLALPQYQKSVEKARSAEILTNVDILSKNAQLYFLNGGTGTMTLKDTLVDLGGCVFPSGADYYCFTKNAEYNFGCNAEGDSPYCFIELYRYDGCLEGGVGTNCTNNTWAIYKRWDNGELTSNTCYTQNTDIGLSICKGLENFGYMLGQEL